MKQMTFTPGAPTQRGLSLVELLIAMVLGVMLIGGTTTVFVGNIRSADLTQTINAMQANARFVLDEITADLRSAGFRGCASVAGTAFHVGTPGAPLDPDAPENSAVVGMRVDGGDWTPGKPTGYTVPLDEAVPIIGTDALLIQYARGPGDPLRSLMSSPAGVIDIAGTVGGLEAGDLAVVSDCRSADLFTVASRTDVVGSVTLQPDERLSRAYDRDTATVPSGARVRPFASLLYYVGDTGRRNRDGDVVRALYVQSYPYTDANPPVELAEGVDQLQLAYGMRADDSSSTRFARSDDAAYDPGRASVIRVGVLMASGDRFDEGAAERRFLLAGRDVVPEGQEGVDDATFPADDRLRLSFERSIAVRNRAPEDMES